MPVDARNLRYTPSLDTGSYYSKMLAFKHRDTAKNVHLTRVKRDQNDKWFGNFNGKLTDLVHSFRDGSSTYIDLFIKIGQLKCIYVGGTFSSFSFLVLYIYIYIYISIYIYILIYIYFLYRIEKNLSSK